MTVKTSQENKEFWRKTKFLHIFPSAASNQNFSTGWHCEHAVIIMRKSCLFLIKIGFFSKWHFSQKNRIFLEMTVKTSQENKQKNGPILDKTFRNMNFSNFKLFEFQTFPTSNFSNPFSPSFLNLTLLKPSPLQLAACSFFVKVSILKPSPWTQGAAGRAGGWLSVRGWHFFGGAPRAFKFGTYNPWDIT